MKIVAAQGEAAASLQIAMTRVYFSQSIAKIESEARKVVAAAAEGDMLRTQMAILRRLSKHDPYNTIDLRQQIATLIIDRGKYSLA
jgi:butyryl-CoA dehydrogenase